MLRTWCRRCTHAADQRSGGDPTSGSCNLYTVANNLVKEHAVLERRRAFSIDIDEAPAHEQLAD
jgi:hypothetical protein